MNAERYQKIKDIFNRAAEMDAVERSYFLDKECGGEAFLRVEIEKMLAFADEETGEDALEKNAFEIFSAVESKMPEKIGNYRIIREIGRGGMGTVYEAVRENRDFRQKAAIKVIKRGMDTDAIVGRFRHEQKILASLEHPFIARFLDGGVTDDNLPFYAMEYVEGEFIDDYCRSRDLSVEEKLKLFRQVCSAVLYAHQNLVIHRDLKPKNILVTKDGTPKLLDFGIGKILTPDAEDEIGTATQFKMMTPAYASPEQIRGQRIGTTSDLYSLGVILYELLTGQKPYPIDLQSHFEIERAVLEIEPARPSSVVKSKRKNPKSKIQNPKFLRGDLDNIILKALRKDASERYLTVGQFSEDIRRYTEGKPVVARPHTFFYRAAKFFKRNRVPAAAAILVFLSLCAGMTVAFYEARRAERQRILAENRFSQVRQLANNVIFKYHDAIAALPGATATREMLVRDATVYLDNLASDATDNPELQCELARAYKKLGDVQGEQYGSNIGDTGGAVESYCKAASLLENIVAADDSNREAAFELIEVYESLFGVYMRTSEETAKVETLNKALHLSEKLIAAEPENANFRAQNVRLLILSGDRQIVEKKLAFYEKALPPGEILYRLHSSDKEFIRLYMRLNQRLGTTHIWLGDAARKKNETAQATKFYASALPFHQKSAELAGELLQLEPQNTLFKRNYVVASNNLAEAFAKNGHRAETLEIMYRGLEVLREMSAVDARNTELKSDAAFAREKIAEMWTEFGETRKAIAEREKAIAMHTEIRRADEKNAEALKSIRENHLFIAELYRRLKNVEKAEYYEKKAEEYLPQPNQK
jgi:tetratricopeptide (TPR) repeat protein